MVRKSRYRPEGNDWAHVGEEEQDRLGALMELALKNQVGQQAREAERIYRAVLEQAPHTHDALHMLGVVRLGLGDYTDAERLIEAAMRLRPSYPAIENNWSLVQRTIAARDRRGIELLSEAALPLLFDSLRLASADRPRVTRTAPASLHLVPCTCGVADAVSRMRRIATLLGPLHPECWNASDGRAVEGWRQFDLHVLDPSTGRRPRAGDVILIGIEGETDWLREPIDRVLVFPLFTTPSLCLERIRRVAGDGARSITLVLESHAKAKHFGASAFVLPPPIDTGLLAQKERREMPRFAGLRISTVGQDGRRVASADDLELLRTVARAPDQLHLLDPGPLRYELGTAKTVKCVARDEMSLNALFESVDVHLHRSLPWWTEDGHDLFAAMAAGVPVLCHRDSVYAEYIQHGVDGWIYEDAASAAAVIAELRQDRSVLALASRAARDKILRAFDPHTLSAAYVDVVRRWQAST